MPARRARRKSAVSKGTEILKEASGVGGMAYQASLES